MEGRLDRAEMKRAIGAVQSRKSFEGEEEMSKRGLVDPTPELPDDTLIADVRFATRIRNVLAAAGLKTVGEIRETADKTMLSFQDLGPDSIASLRRTLGLPSTDGVRPMGKKPA
jgi:DNA-directed RNA polymerase alpha subunit